MGWDQPGQVIALALGVVFGGGRFSPDMDQYGWFRDLRDHLPPRWRRALRHHGLTHSPWLALSGVVVLVALGWLEVVPSVALLVPAAWLWHDLGDALVGRTPYGDDGPGPPWRWAECNRGLGRIKSGGRVCQVLTVGCWVGIAALLVG